MVVKYGELVLKENAQLIKYSLILYAVFWELNPQPVISLVLEKADSIPPVPTQIKVYYAMKNVLNTYRNHI
jgi:hypothetical protein